MHLSKDKFDDAMESFNKARMPAIFPHEESREMWTISFVTLSPPNSIDECQSVPQDLRVEVQWSGNPDSTEKMPITIG